MYIHIYIYVYIYIYIYVPTDAYFCELWRAISRPRFDSL